MLTCSHPGGSKAPLLIKSGQVGNLDLLPHLAMTKRSPFSPRSLVSGEAH